ncbi:MAG: DUF2892 domain-containing protein [Sulfitobacter sp.]|nr:DUF2892 domain-containing protein [Sulfitobacter sp.]
MTANLGTIDRLLRLIIGLALIGMPLLNVPSVWENRGLGFLCMAIGLVLVATALFRFCPIYRVLGISTCQRS